MTDDQKQSFAVKCEKAPNAALLDALLMYQNNYEAVKIIKAEILSRMDTKSM